MKLNDGIDMKGRLTLRLENRAGELVQEIAANNDIVLTGRELVAHLFANIKVDPISHIAVGTDGTGAVAPKTDVKLAAEFFRKAINPIDATQISATGDRVHVMVTAELGLDEANAVLTEAAIFNHKDLNTGIMYNRVIFPPVTKTKDFKLTLVWEIMF
jgi:hypothetical protein